MAIYQLKDKELRVVEATTFSKAGVKEREDLQKLLINQIDIISPDTLVIAEEFGDWEDSRRRIDILGIDKNANLVVIELKRTEDGGHMDLQALRYAAMVSKMTFSRAVDAFEKFLESTDQLGDAQQLILEFLEWDEADETDFAQDVRIVLASADFSKELTTTVIWLNDLGADIKCMRLRPYQDSDKLLLDVQQVIPLPEQEKYQIQIREKALLERVARTQSRDFTKYNVRVGDEHHSRLPKRRAIFYVVKYLCDQGVNPEEIRSLIAWKYDAIRDVDGKLKEVDFREALIKQLVARGKKPEPRRYFIEENQLMYANDKTYALTKMWGRRTEQALAILKDRYTKYDFDYDSDE